jgi:DNA repair exonuclease SbcCD ATPase subunit
MTLNIAELRDRMALRFSDVTQVDETVIRLTRKSQDQPFAVYYIDVASHLPSTPEALNSYQDRIIGSHYFDGRKSLQWSNYLYFVVSDEQSHSKEVLEAKDLIELDRTYARKFIVTESDLDVAIQAPTPTPAVQLPQANILSIWTDKLAEAGLDVAVMSDASLPSRLSLLETSANLPKPKSTKPSPPVHAAKSLFLRSLHLTKYRDFPTQRSFEFGTVNLVVGTNGSGKTSLLEAIELMYCGRNKRNPDASNDYSIAAVFADGSKEVATRARVPKTFRDRNLTWYGQSEVKTNNLFLSFAQFNFLDTDAAVGLAESTAGLEEDLSKLLVGPQASKVWREIERMHDAVSTRLRELRSMKLQISEELAAIEAILKDAGDIKQESDSILTRLEEMSGRVGWKIPPADKEEFIGHLVELLSELGALARQAAVFEWANSPVSLDGLRTYSEGTKQLSDKANANVTQLEGFRNEEKRLAEAQSRCQTQLTLASDARRMVEADVPTRVAELLAQQNILAAQTSALAGYDEKLLSALGESQENIAVAELVRSASSNYNIAAERLAAAKGDHATFTGLRDQSLKLAQELRDIAAQLIQSGPNADQCPLCHTQFGPGELAEHIQLGVDKQIETKAQALLSQIRLLEEDIRVASLAQRAISWLNIFCERARLPGTILLQDGLSQVEETKRTLETAQRRSEALNQEFISLGAKGFSVARLNELREALHRAGHDVTDWSKKSVDNIYEAIEKEQARISGALDVQRTESDKLQLALETTLKTTNADVQGLKKAVLQLRERCALADSLLERFDRLLTSLPWQRDKPLSDMVVEAESVRRVAAEFQAALGRERKGQAAFADSSKRKAQLSKQLAELNPRLKRFTEAEKALDDIQTNHSLNGAMDTALKRNRSGIEEIFGRIHSPAEFAGLGEQLTTLVRKSGGTEASLTPNQHRATCCICALNFLSSKSSVEDCTACSAHRRPNCPRR